MATHRPQPECRETTRSLLSTSATAPVVRRLADKAMSISRHPAQLLRHLPLRVQQLHSRQRLHQRPQQLPRLQRQPRLRQLQQRRQHLQQRQRLQPRHVYTYSNAYRKCPTYCNTNGYCYGYANIDAYCYCNHDTYTAAYSVTKGYCRSQGLGRLPRRDSLLALANLNTNRRHTDGS